jgi:hypothetical protein
MNVIPDTNILIRRPEFDLLNEISRKDASNRLIYNAALNEQIFTDAITTHDRTMSYLHHNTTILLPEVKRQVTYHEERFTAMARIRADMYIYTALHGRTAEAIRTKNENAFILLQQVYLPRFAQKLAFDAPQITPIPAIDTFLDEFAAHYQLNKEQKEDHGTDRALFHAAVNSAVRGNPTILLTNDTELARQIAVLKRAAEIMTPIYEKNGRYPIVERMPIVLKWFEDSPELWHFETQNTLFRHKGMHVPHNGDKAENNAYSHAVNDGVKILRKGMDTLMNVIDEQPAKTDVALINDYSVPLDSLLILLTQSIEGLFAKPAATDSSTLVH